jgi:geranylgeranyl pyrophosphate synthase
VQLLPQLTASLAAITAPVADDMAGLSKNLLSIVGSRSPMLMAAAEQIFGAGGKKLRPVLCFLVARATAQAQGLRCAPAARHPGVWPGGELTAAPRAPAQTPHRQRAHAAAPQAGRDDGDDDVLDECAAAAAAAAARTRAQAG